MNWRTLVRALSLLVLVLFLVALVPLCPAQIFDSNIAAGGVSYAPGAPNPIAGTGLYARLLSESSGTYAFSVIDAVPASFRPFTVTTSVGTGIAQKVMSVQGIDIYVPTSAGISWSGANTGWSWSTGGMAAFRVRTWRVLPNLRMLKSSVNNNSGYQVIVGVLFGRGF